MVQLQAPDATVMCSTGGAARPLITCVVLRPQRNVVVHERMQRKALVAKHEPEVPAWLLEPLHEAHDVLQTLVLPLRIVTRDGVQANVQENPV